MDSNNDITKPSVAYHEAGHAIAAIFYGIKFRKVTIIPDETMSSLGHVLLAKLNLQSDYNTSDKVRIKAEKFIQICLSGPIAEMKFSGRKKSLYSDSDYENAFSVCCHLHGSMKVVNLYIAYLYADAEALFTYPEADNFGTNHTPSWEQVKNLAEALIAKKTLKYDEVIKVINS